MVLLFKECILFLIPRVINAFMRKSISIESARDEGKQIACVSNKFMRIENRI